MIRFKFLLILILVCNQIQGQKLVKIEQMLDSLPSNREKLNYLNHWSYKNYRKLPQEASYYTEQAIKLGQTEKDTLGLANAYMQKARILRNILQFDSAVIYNKIAQEKYSSISDSLNYYKVCINLGLSYEKSNKYDYALQNYYEALTYFEKENHPKILLILYNNLGLVYKQLNNYVKALYYYNKSAKICVDNQFLSSLYLSNTNIANVYSIQKKFKEALLYYKRNLTVLEKNPNKYRLAQTYHNIGACFLEMKQFNMAMVYQNKSLALKEEIGNKKLIINTLNGLSFANYMTENYSKALQYSKRAAELGKEIADIDLQKNTFKDIAKIYTYQLQPDSAITYLNRYEVLRDSLIRQENRKQISEIQAKYEAEKQEKHIAMLEKQNKSKARQRNGLVIILLLISGYAGIIIVSFYRNRKINRLLRLQKLRIEWSKEILHRKNTELSKANQTKNKLFQIISHDLRSPLASISGLSDLIQIFIRQKRYQELNSSSVELKDYVTRVLNLTDNLLNWSMNQHGSLPFRPEKLVLQEQLENNTNIYQTVARQKNINLELVSEADLQVFADKAMLDTILRNLINNAIKFTPEGGVVMIGAKSKSEYTEIWIKDSGIGIPKSELNSIFDISGHQSKSGTCGERGKGLGLILCKDFVEQNRGIIWAESNENIGSTFRFTIPNFENANAIPKNKLQEQYI